MARFRGNVQAGSDKVAATILFIILLVAVLLAAWYFVDTPGFLAFWENLADGVTPD
jgi:hypothetical protein